MKNLIEKWLGIDSLQLRVTCLERENQTLNKKLSDNLDIEEGNAYPINSLVELVFGIMNYLGIKRKVSFLEVPEIIENRAERKFEVVKRKKSKLVKKLWTQN